ncbi:MAG: hypothetical protein GX100_11325 [candidate division WS1 bacterium]|nr:hypothetical protein [candidate division WS1 bacterium]
MHRTTTAATTAVLLTVLCGLLAYASPVQAQRVPESFYAYDQGLPASPLSATVSPFHSIFASDGAWATGKPEAELSHSDLSLAVMHGVTLSRTSRTTAVSLASAPLGTGVNSEVADVLSMAFGSGTQLSLTHRVTALQDLAQRLYSGSEVQTMALAQSFGGGASAGTLNVERAWMTLRNGNNFSHRNTTTVALATGLGKGRDLSSKLVQHTYQDEPGKYSTAYAGALGFDLSGGRGSLQFSNNRAGDRLQSTESTVWSLAAPLRLFSEKTDLAFTRKMTDNNGSLAVDQLSSLSMALPRGHSLTGSLHTKSTQPLGGVLSETTTFTSAYAAPWKAFDTSGAFKQQYLTQSKPDSFQARYVTDLSAQVEGQPFTFQRDHTATRTAAGTTDRVALAVQTPKFQLFTPRATVSASHLQVSDSASPDTARTVVNLDAQPTANLKLSARVQHDTADPELETTSEDVRATLRLSNTLNLHGHLLIKDESLPGGGMVSELQFASEKARPDGLGLLVSHATFDQPSQDTTSASLVQVSAGDPVKSIGVTAQLAQYDPASLVPYDDPLVKVSVAHGAPSRFNIKVDYADQQGRPAPDQQVAVTMPALGGSLQVGYADHPLGRDGKTVVTAERYDAALQRKIGGLDVQLGYREYSCDLPETLVPDRGSLHLQLAGGAEDRGGKIALGYREGDFVPQPNAKVLPPARALDLSYSRRWDADGRLVLTVGSSAPAPDAADQTETVEGRLEFSTAF